MTRAENKALTAKRLRAAGTEVMLEVGVHEASIQQITERAGVAAGTFYLHYKSKADLVDSVVSELNDGLSQALFAAALAEPVPQPRAIVRRLAEALATYWAEHYAQAPLFADHIARHANEQMLRMGTNREAVAFARRLILSVPGIELRATPEFLVSALIGMWRSFGFLAGTIEPPLRPTITDDLVRATETLLDALAPGLLSTDIATLVEALSGPE